MEETDLDLDSGWDLESRLWVLWILEQAVLMRWVLMYRPGEQEVGFVCSDLSLFSFIGHFVVERRLPGKVEISCLTSWSLPISRSEQQN